MSHHKKKFNLINAMKSVSHEITHTGHQLINQPAHIINSAGHAVQGITGEIGLPLLIIGGIVAVAYLRNK